MIYFLHRYYILLSSRQCVWTDPFMKQNHNQILQSCDLSFPRAVLFLVPCTPRAQLLRRCSWKTGPLLGILLLLDSALLASSALLNCLNLYLDFQPLNKLCGWFLGLSPGGTAEDVADVSRGNCMACWAHFPVFPFSPGLWSCKSQSPKQPESNILLQPHETDRSSRPLLFVQVLCSTK